MKVFSMSKNSDITFTQKVSSILFRARRFRLRLRGRLPAAGQPQPAERRCQDVAADPPWPQRFGHDDSSLQGGAVQVGERPAAVRLQGILHCQVIVESTIDSLNQPSRYLLH